MLFSDERITLDQVEKKAEEELDENTLHMRQLLKTKLGGYGPLGSSAQLLEGC